MDKIKQANEYIVKNKAKINKEYRPSYHVTAPIGWLNDPNGFSMYKGEYHLFYQHYPYGSEWGPMHWGHVKSKDLVRWEDLPVALAPDKFYDQDGCFSGSAVEKDGKLHLFYTGNINGDGGSIEKDLQIQNMAISEDGIIFDKVENNPIVRTSQLPEHGVAAHFRDPKVIESDGIYYMVVGSCRKDDTGQILLYESDDLHDWNYKGVLLKSDETWGEMWECPDLFHLQGEDILIASPQFLPRKGDRYWNVYSSIYLVGQCNFETCSYDYSKIEEIDYGLDFYAPQTLIDAKGRRIMIAWMQMWHRKFPTHIQNHHWANAMTLPRELKIKDGKLYQYPIAEVKDYRENAIFHKDVIVTDALNLAGVSGQCIEFEVEVDIVDAKKFGIAIFKGGGEQTLMFYNATTGKFVFDRSQSGEDLGGHKVEKITKDIRQVSIGLRDNKLKLRIFMDRMSVEIFIQDGEWVMTSTVFPKSTSTGIEFFAEGKAVIKALHKWDIVVS